MTTIEPMTADSAVLPKLTAIHHVGVTVTDVKASAAWYERVLGFRMLFEERHFRSDPPVQPIRYHRRRARP